MVVHMKKRVQRDIGKKVQRKVSAPLYLVAFVITAVIFAIGVFIGERLVQDSELGLSDELSQIGEQLSSTELLLLAGDAPEFCPLYAQELEQLDERTDGLGYRLSYLEEVQGKLDEKLKDSYFRLETQAYLLARSIREKCHETYPVVLYFYSNTNCDQCREQGTILLEMKHKNPAMRIYSFDGDLNSTVVEALKDLYNTTVYPTVVVNERTYAGMQDSAAILSAIENS